MIRTIIGIMNKKILYLLIITLFSFTSNSIAQSGIWEWGREINGPSNEDEIDAVGADAFGNVFISGKFEDSLKISGSPDWVVSNGMADIMLAKYDSLGVLQWTKFYGGTGEDNTFDADCDQAGNVILSGYFQNTITFDTITLTSLGGFDAFIAKISKDGDVIWAKQYGGTGDDGGNEVSIGTNGQIIIGAISLGDFSFESFSFTNPNHALRDSYVISLDSDGNVNWVRTISGLGSCQSKSIAVDRLGNVYAGGDFIGPNYIVDENNVHHNIQSNGQRDAYLTSWDSTGNLRWFKTWGGSGNDMCKGLATTDDLSVYAAGPFFQTVNFDTIQIVGDATEDFYFWKLDTDGNSQWVRHLYSPDDILYGGEIVNDGKGGVVMGIGLTDTLYMQDGNDFTAFPLPNDMGNYYPFILQYDKQGNISFTKFSDNNSGNGTFGEIARSGNRIFLDVILYGSLTFNNTISSMGATDKDAGVVSIVLPNSTASVEESKLSDLKIFPNPTTEILYIQLPLNNFKVAIYSLQGQLLVTEENTKMINCATLPMGTYLIKVITPNTIYSKLFIKE